MGVEKETLVASSGISRDGQDVGKVLRQDTVTVHYKAFYVHDGKTKLYENTRRWFFGRKVVFTVGAHKSHVMVGLDVGVQKMALGEKAKLCITPDLAFAEYGHKGPQGKVPPNATVLMEMEVLSIERNGVEHLSDSASSSCFA